MLPLAAAQIPRRFAVLLARDTFNRVTTAGASMGNADVGGAWSGGTGGVNADGNSLRFALTSNQTRLLTLPVSVADVDQRMVWEVGALPSSGSYTMSQMARYASSTVHYRLRATVDSGGVLRVGAAYVNGGAETLIGSNVIVPSVTVAINTLYVLRSRLVGTRMQVKAWAASEDEPATWTYDQTDSTIAAAGNIGLRIAAGSSPTLALSVDTYEARSGRGIVPLRVADSGGQLFALQAEDTSALQAEDTTALYGVTA